MSPTAAAFFGSITTAVAIFGGGLAVEAYRHRRARIGMALALAGAVDALLRLVEQRDVASKLEAFLPELEAGRPVRIAALMGANVPFQTITNAYAGQIGSLGGDLPFRVARFLTHSYGVHLDMMRLADGDEAPHAKAAMIRELQPLWAQTSSLGDGLVDDLCKSVGRKASPRLTAAGTRPGPGSPAGR